MTSTEMLAFITQRTRQTDVVKILRELRSAHTWVALNLFNAGGGDLCVTIGEELPALVAVTRDFDLGAVTSGTFLSIKTLWLKFPSDSRFVPMIENDSTDPEFEVTDSATVADPDIAYGHPVRYDVLNFQKVRFARALPVGAIIRADYSKIALPPDPATNDTATSGTDLSELFHEAEVNKTCAQIFTSQEDDRVAQYEVRAREMLNAAIYAALKRKRGPTRTKPFRGR